MVRVTCSLHFHNKWLYSIYDSGWGIVDFRSNPFFHNCDSPALHNKGGNLLSYPVHALPVLPARGTQHWKPPWSCHPRAALCRWGVWWNSDPWFSQGHPSSPAGSEDHWGLLSRGWTPTAYKTHKWRKENSWNDQNAPLLTFLLPLSCKFKTYYHSSEEQQFFLALRAWIYHNRVADYLSNITNSLVDTLFWYKHGLENNESILCIQCMSHYVVYAHSELKTNVNPS